MYNIYDKVIVHTKKMKSQLIKEFNVKEDKIEIIPFGINNTIPKTDLTFEKARIKLGLAETDKVILFFGNIAPYKGLKSLILAFTNLINESKKFKLIIAGGVKDCNDYWQDIEKLIAVSCLNKFIKKRIEIIPDNEVEIYFKAAHLLVLPYTFIFQSGVLFLSYYFGLPVVASDVGSLREDVVQGETGFICRAEDPTDLAHTISKYFESDLFNNLDSERNKIIDFAEKNNSWASIAKKTKAVYSEVLS
jgi:glycosyltransferase involved in cell wall biosynthesis